MYVRTLLFVERNISGVGVDGRLGIFLRHFHASYFNTILNVCSLNFHAFMQLQLVYICCSASVSAATCFSCKRIEQGHCVRKFFGVVDPRGYTVLLALLVACSRLGTRGKMFNTEKLDAFASILLFPQFATSPPFQFDFHLL